MIIDSSLFGIILPIVLFLILVVFVLLLCREYVKSLRAIYPNFYDSLQKSSIANKANINVPSKEGFQSEFFVAFTIFRKLNSYNNILSSDSSTSENYLKMTGYGKKFAIRMYLITIIFLFIMGLWFWRVVY